MQCDDSSLAMSSHDELAGCPEPGAIWSGHYMVSNLDDRSSSDEDDLPQTIVEAQHKAGEKINHQWRAKSDVLKSSGRRNQRPFLFNAGKKKSAIVSDLDISQLARLFDCLSVYSEQLTTPRWNHFRGLRLSRTDRIRLNNLIWREFYTQIVRQLKPVFVKFETPTLENHQGIRSLVLEGKYWKRRFDSVCVEYLRWRCYYKLRLSGRGYPYEMTDEELLEKVAGPTQPGAMSLSANDTMDTEDLLSDLFSNVEWLLDGATTTAGGFPMPMGSGGMVNTQAEAGVAGGNADTMQPLLLQMTPNLEDMGDLHTILATPNTSPAPLGGSATMNFTSLLDATSGPPPDLPDANTAALPELGLQPSVLIAQALPIFAQQQQQLLQQQQPPQQQQAGAVRTESTRRHSGPQPAPPADPCPGPLPCRSGLTPRRKEPYPRRRKRSTGSMVSNRPLPAIAPKPVSALTSTSRAANTAQLPRRTGPLADLASPAPSAVRRDLDCQRLLCNVNRSFTELRSERRRQHQLPAPEEDSSSGDSSSIIPAAVPALPVVSSTSEVEPPGAQRGPSSEVRRRGNINQGLVFLHSLLPESVCRGPGAKMMPMSKAMILLRSSEYLRRLRQEQVEAMVMCANLRNEVEELQKEINDCCAKLPETGLPMLPVSRDKGLQWFRAYVRASTLRNSKFYIFSLIAEKLFAAYTSMVSMNNVQEFTVSVMTWLEQHCSMSALRNYVNAALLKLCTKTSILTDPSKLPQEAVCEVSEAEADSHAR